MLSAYPYLFETLLLGLSSNPLGLLTLDRFPSRTTNLFALLVPVVKHWRLIRQGLGKRTPRLVHMKRGLRAIGFSDW